MNRITEYTIPLSNLENTNNDIMKSDLKRITRFVMLKGPTRELFRIGEKRSDKLEFKSKLYNIFRSCSLRDVKKICVFLSAPKEGMNMWSKYSYFKRRKVLVHIEIVNPFNFENTLWVLFIERNVTWIGYENLKTPCIVILAADKSFQNTTLSPFISFRTQEKQLVLWHLNLSLYYHYCGY